VVTCEIKLLTISAFVDVRLK